MIKKEYALGLSTTELIAQFTDLTDQAHGSVILRLGNTTVLATAVMSDEQRDGLGYFPLTVDYEEKFYATGKILGSRFMRREGRPSDEAVLSGRIVDRTVRPLFDHHIRNDVQVVITVLSIDENDPDTLAVNATSLALAVSDIPWKGPVSAVRIGKLKSNDELLINPTYSQRESEEYEFDMVACGKDGNINMIEVGSNEVSDELLVKALELASKEIERIQEFQVRIIREQGVKKRVIDEPIVPNEVTALFKKHIEPILEEKLVNGKQGYGELNKMWRTVAKEELENYDNNIVNDYIEHAIDQKIHSLALNDKKRVDGRAFDEVRPLFAQAGGVSPIIHGSGIFYRGGTHVLSALTLGGPQDSQIIDGMELQAKKHFIHHYNFPPYSVGEAGRMGGFNRRMIGHGALAEKAMIPVLPGKSEFPYTIRIVSESMASNGSTSMASVCGSTLALMDAGVPIKSPVAGIASGLIMKSATEYVLLTDIQGPEDHHGDMDFKVAGTKTGVTAIQMDVKVDGIPIAILKEALSSAKKARLHILETITAEIDKPRADINPNAPKIVTLQINPEKIGMIIGSGGKTINEIREKTNTEIEIEEDGLVYITGKADAPLKAKKIIEEMTHEFAKGEKLAGTVVKITDFGAFVKIGYNTEGLVHISEIAPWRVGNVRDLLKEGASVPVVVKELGEGGKISLSIKLVDPNFFKKPQ